MALSVAGVRLVDLSFEKEAGGERLKPKGNYEIMSDKGTVIAKASFNGYNDVRVEMSPATTLLMQQMRESIQNDLAIQLGLV